MKNKCQTLDQYYTKSCVVARCLAELRHLTRAYDFVIEPSAGDGAFLKLIPYTCKVLGIDVAPHHKDILKENWLLYSIDRNYKDVLVVGNPPFGVHHNASRAFIKHAMSFGNVKTIAFILPNGYLKYNQQKWIPKDWRIMSILSLGRDCFVKDGKDYHVPTSFFVFDKSIGVDLRVEQGNRTENHDFAFATKKDYDIFVSGNNKKVLRTAVTSKHRGYYLKSKISVDKLIARVDSVPWQGHSSASGGVFWLTKQEFINQYTSHHYPEGDV